MDIIWPNIITLLLEKLSLQSIIHKICTHLYQHFGGVCDRKQKKNAFVCLCNTKVVYTIKNNKAVYSKKNSEHSSALCEIGRGIYSDSVIFEQRSLGGET